MSEDLGGRTTSEEAARREEASALEGLKDLQQGWEISLVHELPSERSNRARVSKWCFNCEFS
jgi:hypothetical protein